MTQYLPYIFGTISLLFGVFVFLFAFKIYKPKQTTEKEKERMERWHEKFGTFLKIASFLLIINGAYDLIANNQDRYRIGNTEKTEWAEWDRQELIERCVREAGTTANIYPAITREYCECSIDKIMTTMSYMEYVENSEKPTDEQLSEIMPLIQSCTDELNRRIEEEETQ
jgi:hypothetical protein